MWEGAERAVDLPSHLGVDGGRDDPVLAALLLVRLVPPSRSHIRKSPERKCQSHLNPGVGAFPAKLPIFNFSHLG